jgi:hypothetical protein
MLNPAAYLAAGAAAAAAPFFYGRDAFRYSRPSLSFSSSGVCVCSFFHLCPSLACLSHSMVYSCD